MRAKELKDDVESLKGVNHASTQLAGMQNDETELVIDWNPNKTLDSDILDYVHNHHTTKGFNVELTQADDDALVIRIH